ncbi:MAG: YihA family ribosome biogenesis GTP-binding protein [Gammaproteobacteria bacterium RIFCSPHIGHO2_12_FULL_45_9]|nr:MAG: YihA family ribosome biogenesis GTP-binding protein [Gammaproteobacteria bacterium RIFCSPHIGHO2_12_FULL_45_9]
MDQNLEDFARWLFTQECIFTRGIESTASLPDPIFPEIAFVGRSNVGKSSLINAVLGRKALARVSHTPGRTQQLNFFLLGKRIYIVDMPGYGYAAVSKTKLKLFSRLIMDYLKGRVPLKRVFLLIDSRHGLKPPDHSVMDTLDKAAISYQIILTKIDKCSSEHLEMLSTSLTEILKTHPAAFPAILSTSSIEKSGIEKVRETIAEMVF